MKLVLFFSFFTIVFLDAPAIGAIEEVENKTVEHKQIDAIEYIRSAVQENPIVCLAEGGHQAREPHQFLRRVLSDEVILSTVDVVIVEFAAAKHQDVLDAYIRGEDVPQTNLCKVWRDTGQSPNGPWDSPLYHQLLEVIRSANQNLPTQQKVRVLAGDPPIDWEDIKTRNDYAASCAPRDPYVANLAIRQAIDLDKRVLIIFGGAHLPRVPIAPNDLRNSLTYHILQQHPNAVKAISFFKPENLGVEDRIDELEQGKVYLTDHHWVGELNGGLIFPEIYSLVTSENTGKKSWQKVPLYSEYLVRDLFDALIYIGPTSTWEYVPGSFDPEGDRDYLKELERRRRIRFGQ